eukprot:364603-Prorocentrum_minimum.AAC.1
MLIRALFLLLCLLCCCHACCHYLVRDARAAGEHRSEADGGEGIRVVGLGGVHRSRRARGGGPYKRGEGASAGEDGPPARPAHGVFEGALGLGGGIGEGEDDGALVQGGHQAEGILVEGAGDGGDADETSGLQRPDGLEQGGGVGDVVRERDLVLLQGLAAGGAHQSLGVHEETSFASLG